MSKETTRFTIECEMKERWVPHFLGMLKKMQQLGSMGSSRHVGIYADGDGDFRPKFQWEDTLPEPAKLSQEDPSNTKSFMYDAG